MINLRKKNKSYNHLFFVFCSTKGCRPRGGYGRGHGHGHGHGYGYGCSGAPPKGKPATNDSPVNLDANISDKV